MTSLTITDYIFIGLGAASIVLWLSFFLIGQKNAKIFETLDEKNFPLKDVYFVGYTILELFHYGYKSKRDRKLRKQLEILYSAKYVEFYLRVIHAQQLTFATLLAAVAFSVYGLTQAAVSIVVLVFAGTAYYYFGTAAEKQVLSRSEEMLNDFSTVVSKLALLTNAGMIMREAWEEVSNAGDSAIYAEMRTAVDEMRNGVSEVDAIYHFGSRCSSQEIKKFASTLMQGITKGNKDLALALQQQSSEVWQQKKQIVRRAGEKAASKLMIPIFMMFIGILVMIIVPIFTNLGF